MFTGVYILIGVIFSVIAGAAMSFQGVMNTGLSDDSGLLEANLFVQGTAFALSLVAVLIAGGGGLPSIQKSAWMFKLGGALGLVITVTVMVAVKKLSASVAIPVILIAQLITAAMIDAFGWLGQERVEFGWNKYVGAAVMTGGVLLFKWKT